MTQLTPAPNVWTVNAPDPIAIAVGGSYVVSLDTRDFDPTDIARAAGLADEILNVAASLTISATPGAIKSDVASGQWRSPSTRSYPPHRWLFG